MRRLTVWSCVWASCKSASRPARVSAGGGGQRRVIKELGCCFGGLAARGGDDGLDVTMEGQLERGALGLGHPLEEMGDLVVVGAGVPGLGRWDAGLKGCKQLGEGALLVTIVDNDRPRYQAGLARYAVQLVVWRGPASIPRRAC